MKVRLWSGGSCTLLATVLAAFVPAPARALQTAGAVAVPLAAPSSITLSLGASLGTAAGTAQERVFDYPLGKKFKLSELTWDFGRVPVAGVQASAGLGARLRFNVGYWSALSGGNGSMRDRDWLYDSYFAAGQIDPGAIGDDDWTHQSDHPDTTVDSGSVLDINLAARGLQRGALSISAILGYRRDAWKWSARGGTGIYSPFKDPFTADLTAFRSRPVVFPEGELLIVYEQRYEIPYVGLGATWSVPAFTVDARLLLSSLVRASDTDEHITRGLRYEGDFSHGVFVGIDCDARWAFAQRWTAMLGLQYQSISEITGDSRVDVAGIGSVAEGSVGVALRSAMLTLGAEYRF